MLDFYLKQHNKTEYESNEKWYMYLLLEYLYISRSTGAVVNDWLFSETAQNFSVIINWDTSVQKQKENYTLLRLTHKWQSNCGGKKGYRRAKTDYCLDFI